MGLGRNMTKYRISCISLNYVIIFPRKCKFLINMFPGSNMIKCQSSFISLSYLAILPGKCKLSIKMGLGRNDEMSNFVYFVELHHYFAGKVCLRRNMTKCRSSCISLNYVIILPGNCKISIKNGSGAL